MARSSKPASAPRLKSRPATASSLASTPVPKSKSTARISSSSRKTRFWESFRMPKFFRAALLAALGAGLAAAQAKIGIVNSARAISATAEIKKAQADLEARFKPRQDELAKLQQDLQTIQSQLQ